MMLQQNTIAQNIYQKNKLVRPFLKWVGGKRQLMSDIKGVIPQQVSTYYEPFVGGGAVLFNLQHSQAVISDCNAELINVYRVIKNKPEELILDLAKHKNTSDYFYEMRQKDREPEVYAIMSDVEKASRIIFLNKTCFNGLYRVNNSGEFNSPFGRYTNPKFEDKTTIRAVSKYLNQNDVLILNGDFQSAVTEAEKGDFVYFDPPYDPVSSSASFTGYAKGGFDRSEQERLKEVCDHLNSRGVKFLVSNSATKFIKELYSNYPIGIVRAKRAINSNGSDRGEVAEVLIRNYGK